MHLPPLPQQPDPVALKAVFQAAVSCPGCGGPANWYSGGFGSSWWNAEVGRCERGCGIETPKGKNVFSPMLASEVIRHAFYAGVEQGKNHA